MNRIALFAKPAVAGRVKTRLSPALPAQQACELYAALLQDTIQEVDRAMVDERAIWWSAPPEPLARVPLPVGWREATQRGADLGERMRNAFETLLMGGSRAVIVGADCPTLQASHINAAFAALDTHDLVFGPATDGGYYLVGLAGPQPRVFEGIAWSTASVLNESFSRAEAAGLHVDVLEPLADLDTPSDLVRWIGRVAAGGAASAVRGRAVLHRLGLAPTA